MGGKLSAYVFPMPSFTEWATEFLVHGGPLSSLLDSLAKDLSVLFCLFQKTVLVLLIFSIAFWSLHCLLSDLYWLLSLRTKLAPLK